MKRFAAIAVIFLSMSVSACAQFGSFKNPADQNTVDKIGVTYRTVLDGAVTYRDLCNKKVIKRATCAPIVSKLDAANQNVLVAYRGLNDFVKKNPTIDAISLITALKDAVDGFKATANQLGVI